MTCVCSHKLVLQLHRVLTVRCCAAALAGELPASETPLELDTSQHGFLSQVVELIEQLTLVRLCQTGMTTDPTVQKILSFGCSPTQTQATQDLDNNLHTSSAAHVCQQPSLQDTLSSIISKNQPNTGTLLLTPCSTAEHSIFRQTTSSAMCEPVQPWPQPSKEDWVDIQLLASKAGMQFQWLMIGSASDSTHQQHIRSTLLKAIAKVLALSFTGTRSVFLLTSLQILVPHLQPEEPCGVLSEYGLTLSYVMKRFGHAVSYTQQCHTM